MSGRKKKAEVSVMTRNVFAATAVLLSLLRSVDANATIGLPDVESCNSDSDCLSITNTRTAHGFGLFVRSYNGTGISGADDWGVGVLGSGVTGVEGDGSPSGYGVYGVIVPA